MTMITLSFDNGPEPEVTPLVLETLRRHQIKSTFFVLGRKLREHRHLAQAVHSEGHWIGNHTYSHNIPLGETSAGVAAAEIERTQELIGALAHQRKFFRPFGGGGHLDQRLLNAEAVEALSTGRYTCVLWNVIAEDWNHPEGWVERALHACLAQQHALVVLHDLPTGAMHDLDRFISEAREAGAEFQQDFPEECIPLERGALMRDISPFVTASS